MVSNAAKNQLAPACAHEVRRLTKQLHLWLSHGPVKAPVPVRTHCTLETLPDETDAKQILTASPQLTWLRTVHSGDWCLRSALRTLSGACQKRTNMSVLLLLGSWKWRKTSQISRHAWFTYYVFIAVAYTWAWPCWQECVWQRNYNILSVAKSIFSDLCYPVLWLGTMLIADAVLSTVSVSVDTPVTDNACFSHIRQHSVSKSV